MHNMFMCCLKLWVTDRSRHASTTSTPSSIEKTRKSKRWDVRRPQKRQKGTNHVSSRARGPQKGFPEGPEKDNCVSSGARGLQKGFPYR